MLVHNACLISNSDGSYDIELSYKDGWSDAQKAAADNKVAALSKAITIKIDPQDIDRGNKSASAVFKLAFGKGSVPTGSDVDHIIDLQLGGLNDISNMSPLDSSVNRSLGSQIQHLIRNLPVGTILGNFSIK